MDDRSRGYGVAAIALSVAGALVVGGAAGPVVAQDAASLTVYAEDASGERVTDALFILYDADWTKLQQRRTDANGRVRWQGLAAGTYNVELYGPRGGFWGGSEVRLGTDGEETVTITRIEPYLSHVAVADGSGDGVYRPGEAVVVSADVHNGQDFPQQVRVSFAVDADGDGTADAATTRRPREIGERSTATFEYRLTPERSGTYRLRIEVETEVGGGWAVTDTPEWSRQFTVRSAATPTATPTPTPTATPTATLTPTPTAPPPESTDRFVSPSLLFVLICGVVVGVIVGYTRMTE